MPPYRQRPASERSAASRGIISVVIVLVLVAIAATAWMVSTSLHSGTASSAGGQTPGSGTGSASTSSAPAAAVLKPVGANTYDAFEPSNNEHAADVGNAIDGNPATSWSTQWYLGNPVFGGYKPGTGLILDMGKPVKLSQLQVIFSKSCCTSAAIYVGNTNVVSKAAFATFTKVATASKISGTYTYTISSSATGRYVLIWLTSLPPALPNSGAQPGSYQEQIYEVTVRGTAATAAG